MSIINAQNRKILGYVLSNQTNSSIENVNIFINDEGIGTSSKSDGYFSLEKIPDSDFELSFSIIGFQDTSVFVTSKDNQINIGKFYLELSVIGFEEINVALGGTLHPEIRDLPGRMNHRMPPDGTLEQKFALRHKVTFLPGSVFEKIFCKKEINVNSLHGQGIDQPGQRVSIDGYAPDGTPEAISIAGSKGFCLAVQWHPEWQASRDENSVKLFSAFRDALINETFASSEEKLVG